MLYVDLPHQDAAVASSALFTIVAVVLYCFYVQHSEFCMFFKISIQKWESLYIYIYIIILIHLKKRLLKAHVLDIHSMLCDSSHPQTKVLVSWDMYASRPNGMEQTTLITNHHPYHTYTFPWRSSRTPEDTNHQPSWRPSGPGGRRKASWSWLKQPALHKQKGGAPLF